MSYNAQWNATCSNRTDHRIEFYIQRNATSGNSSNYYWQLGMRRMGAWYGTYTGSQEPWSVYVGGQINGSSSYPFSSGTSFILMGSGTSGWFGHDANGNMSMWVDGQQHGSFFGYCIAGGTFYADRIPKPPPAPTPLSGSPDQIETTSMRYQFTSNGDGGSTIIRWETQYSTSPTFASGNSAIINSSGTRTYTGLNPGTTYYFRSRGVNAVGAGAWSATRSATTKSGVFVGYGNSFPGAECLVGVGGAFVTAEIYVPDGAGNWVLAGA